MNGKIRQYAGVLAVPSFRFLWLAQVCAKLAEHFLNFLLVILLFQITESPFFVSLLVVLVSIPPILFSAMAGVFADSSDRKRIMQVTNVARSLLVVMLLFGWHQPAMLLATALILSVFAQFFSPAEVASIPTLVPAQQLFAANSFYQLTGYAAFLIGYSLAGPALHRLGPELSMGIPLILYAGATMFISFLPALTQHLSGQSLAASVRSRYVEFWLRLMAGVRFIRQHPVVLFLIVQLGVVFSIEKGFISLAPSFSQDFLQFNVEQISLFLIFPTGVGALAGAIVANRVKRKFHKDRLINFGMILDGLALLLIALTTHIVSLGTNLGLDSQAWLRIFVAAMAFCSGFADPFIIVSAQTAIHQLVPNGDRGRVFGALFTIINIMSIIPVLIIGALVTRGFPIPVMVVGLSVLILAAAAFGIGYYRRNRLGREAPSSPVTS